ncbi:LPS-assembly protein [Loktanella ponticola]|uniref:LPS-assembly protein LptD n=1 Tax=Yoonia ponticola TaxID=1524255 RepID=A0A7W9BKI0_9RHOB|nr:LPS assembly protein LptD [Yoonia ponticola]MBB5721967.1 LPS-assembly protein [Yoonia ponticola]
MRFLFTCLFLLSPLAAAAQGVATLVADSVSIEGDDRLIANGNIEVFYDDTRLSAASIIYDRTGDQLIIEGPIYIQTVDGEIITADRATLDPKLENGMLRGARLVLDQQLQLAANQIDRVEGRYSQLNRVVASSCSVCNGGPALWDIRAERVVHDQDAQQLYFENATFRVRGLPVMWLPYARLPDPTLDRSTGLLIPDFRNSDLLGFGIKVPYFITLGEHRDLTLTPYLSSETTTLEASYREAFLSGDLNIEGALSQDTLDEDRRSYLFADGEFDLGGGTVLSFDIKTVSDTAYLTEYGYADLDRLESSVTLENITADRLFRARFSFFETLRDDEENATLPPIVADLRYEKRDELLGGDVTYGFSGDVVIRTGTGTGDDGRDVGRIGSFGSWTRDLNLPAGLQGDVTGALRADQYFIKDDSAYASSFTRLVPTIGATFSWPLIAGSTTGASHMLTPTLAVAWSDAYGDTPPNEDSTRAELDQSNLFDLSRFPGDDRVETGTRAALGVTYTRQGAASSFSSLTFGRVVRSSSDDDFSASSGLAGKASDWLLAGQITSPQGVHFDGRVLVSDALETTRGAGRLGWRTDTVTLDAAYIWQAADATESRPDAVSEWTLDTAVQLNDAFKLSADARYDIAADSPATAGLGVEWRNECVTVDLSVSRRFTSSDTIDPSTDYGLSVSLNGFSAGRSAQGPSAGCQK